MNNGTAWPSLSIDAWEDTYGTLHMWTQIVGKIVLATTPRSNHFWNVALRITPRGLSTPLLTYKAHSFTILFDFITHQLIIQCSDGRIDTIPLESRTVADFYGLLMQTLRRLGIDVQIWPMPVEIPNPIRFDSDVTHHLYDGAAANAFWRILVTIEPIFEQFRCRFIGKSSPVHFFWGSFDLASTRFSGRRAPERSGADAITQEAYSHEVISHGFWPGSGAIREPSFYAYAAPEPPEFKRAAVLPENAFYSTDMSEFILPYESVRTGNSPARDLTAFLQSTYNAGADLANWDRANLERGADL